MGKVPSNFHGKKGVSGRKSAYQEKADAQFLADAFFGKIDQEEIETAIRSGKFSIKERFLLTAMEGEPRILNALFAKLFPDKMEIKDETNLKIDV